ncbi:hypothetical protein LIX60_17425 [Streptomyces sp. S07_1.15]|nr:hypothetical protein [Streptomyces sp. S07_1.15]
MTHPIPGYWCECWTDSPSCTQRPALLASIETYSAPQAVRWIAIALRTITSGLEPAAAAQAWDWLHEGRSATTKALHSGEPCTVSVNSHGTHVTWTARPVLLLPLAHRQNTNLPDCAWLFRPTTAD